MAAAVVKRVLCLLSFASAAGATTCAQVKRAYRQARCCDANEATQEVDMPGEDGLHRRGCESMVAENMTAGPVVGGTLYVYDVGAPGEPQWKHFEGRPYVDLAVSSIAAGCVPKHKPHMVRPSPDGKHTAVTYTGDQDFAILKNDEHRVIFCPTVDFLRPHVFGGATHDGAWYGAGSFLLLDMTGCYDGFCGGVINRFDFTFDAAGDMTGTAYNSSLGSQGVREARGTASTKPISLGNNPYGSYEHLFYVTDTRGAGSIMDARTMTWVRHFGVAEFGDCPTGGLWVEPHPDGHTLLVQYGSQGDDTAVGHSCLFTVDVATLTMELLVELDDNADAHGIQFCQAASGWTVINTNRQTSTLDVVTFPQGTFLLRGYDMNAEVFNHMNLSFNTEERRARRLQSSEDVLQPDVIYLHDGFLYMAARGPHPVSAVRAQNFRENAHPGLMALKIDPQTCLPAADQSEAFALITLERSPQITSDVHGAWGVMNGGQKEIWAVDQAGTGSVQSYSVYSNCAAYGVTDIHDDP